MQVLVCRQRIARLSAAIAFVGFVALLQTAHAKDAAPAKTKQITFTKHIAPILWKNCAGCHRPGEVGPFSLLTYEDASKRADFLAEITASHRMPPWKPEPDFGKFRDERRLSDREIDLIAKWAAAGAPQGAAKDLPEPPKFPDGWQLGEPEMVLEMPESFTVPAGGRDIYRCFVIPIPAQKDRVVSGVEFRPGNRRVVHHAIMYLDANGMARKLDAVDDKEGFETFGGPGIVPTGGLGGWAPGYVPRYLPDGMVRYLRKGSDLVLQVHYHPSGKEETDRSMVGIHFSKQPIKKIVTGIAVLQTKLDIPPDNAHVEVTAESQELPVNVHVLGVSPHMHNLGREIKVTALVPDRAKEIPLIWIKDWDFNWQGSYELAKPIELPKGSKIKVLSVYDNSTANPKNPNSPPKAVHWGEQTTDEMCLCGVQVFTDKLTELKQIAAMRNNELGAGLEGGIPGQADAARKQTAKALAAKKTDTKKKQPARKKADAEEVATTDPATSATAPATPEPEPAKDNPPAAQPEEAKSPDQPAEADGKKPKFPANGLALDESGKAFFGKFDLNHDGRLTEDEVAKMPPETATIVRNYAARAKK
jgi:mono/diheme cytochrome c family protein